MSTYDVILPPLKGDIAKKFWQAYHASGITQEAIDKANKSRERIAKQGFKPNKWLEAFFVKGVLLITDVGRRTNRYW